LQIIIKLKVRKINNLLVREKTITYNKPEIARLIKIGGSNFCKIKLIGFLSPRIDATLKLNMKKMNTPYINIKFAAAKEP